MAKRLGTALLRAMMEKITVETLIKYDLLPASNGETSLGSDTKRYANIYCQDLNLANDRGDFTLIEEEEYLSIRNNKTGKVYRIVMEEVTAGDK